MKEWFKQRKGYLTEWIIIIAGILVFSSGYQYDKNITMVWGCMIMWAGVTTGHRYRIEELEKKIK